MLGEGGSEVTKLGHYYVVRTYMLIIAGVKIYPLVPYYFEFKLPSYNSYVSNVTIGVQNSLHATVSIVNP